MVTWQLTIDARDPARQVAFWASVLGYEPMPPPEGFSAWNDWYRAVGVDEDELDPTGDGTDRLRDPAGEGPDIWFQVVPEPKTVKNRLHLDVRVGGGRSVPIEERVPRVEEKVAECVAAGARIHRRFPDDFETAEDPGRYSVVMLDPEGNEFCVV